MAFYAFKTEQKEIRPVKCVDQTYLVEWNLLTKLIYDKHKQANIWMWWKSWKKKFPHEKHVHNIYCTRGILEGILRKFNTWKSLL